MLFIPYIYIPYVIFLFLIYKIACAIIIYLLFNPICQLFFKEKNSSITVTLDLHL